MEETDPAPQTHSLAPAALRLGNVPGRVEPPQIPGQEPMRSEALRALPESPEPAPPACRLMTAGPSVEKLDGLLDESRAGEPREFRVSVDAFADLMDGAA